MEKPRPVRIRAIATDETHIQIHLAKADDMDEAHRVQAMVKEFDVSGCAAWTPIGVCLTISPLYNAQEMCEWIEDAYYSLKGV